MTTRWLKYFNPFLFLLCFLFVTAVQTTLSKTHLLGWLHLDFWVLAIVWFGLRRSFEEGGLLTLLVAHLTELQSSSPAGLFSQSLMLLFFSIRFANQIFIIQSLKDYCWSVFWGTWVWKFFFWNLGLFFFGVSSSVIDLLLETIFHSFLNTGVAFFIFQGLEKYDFITHQYNEFEKNGKRPPSFETF